MIQMDSYRGELWGSLILLGVFAVTGCATPPGGGEITYAQTAPIGSGGSEVSVTVDAAPLSGDRRNAFLRHGGSAKLVAKVMEHLQGPSVQGRHVPDELKITVTDFRLRSGSSGFWLGAMAGADMLAASVQVIRTGKVEKTFSTDTSTLVAGVIRPGSVERFNRMVNTLAQRIVAGI
jgi:hypothetical protein